MANLRFELSISRENPQIPDQKDCTVSEKTSVMRIYRTYYRLNSLQDRRSVVVLVIIIVVIIILRHKKIIFLKESGTVFTEHLLVTEIRLKPKF